MINTAPSSPTAIASLKFNARMSFKSLVVPLFRTCQPPAVVVVVEVVVVLVVVVVVVVVVVEVVVDVVVVVVVEVVEVVVVVVVEVVVAVVVVVVVVSAAVVVVVAVAPHPIREYPRNDTETQRHSNKTYFFILFLLDIFNQLSHA